MSATMPDSADVPRDATPAALEIENLSVLFRSGGRSTSAVDRVSLRVEPGRVLAVVGESGCGKSATAMAVLGLLPDTATVTGSARVGGRELIGLGESALSDVRGRDAGIVFQEPMTSLSPVMRVGAQVGEVLRRHTGLSRHDTRERVVELFARVGIPEPRRRTREYPHQLSGGMRQRVMIAMAVACSPAVVIADEPTTALDVTVQATILDILRSLAAESGTGVLLITHDLGVVADVADEVAVMYAGRVVEQAPVDDLFATAEHPYTRALLAATPMPDARRDRLAELPGVVPTLTQAVSYCAFRDRCDREVAECGTNRPELRERRPGHLAACFNPEPAGQLR